MYLVFIPCFFQNLALNVCNEKADWLENTPGAVTQDFITQKQALNEALAPIWTKLSEPRKYYQYYSYLIYLCIFKKLLLRLAVVKLSKQFFWVKKQMFWFSAQQLEKKNIHIQQLNAGLRYLLCWLIKGDAAVFHQTINVLHVSDF